MRKALGIAELKAVLGVSEPVLYRILTNGELKGQKVGRQWRCSEDAVRRYLGGGSGEQSQPEPTGE